MTATLCVVQLPGRILTGSCSHPLESGIPCSECTEVCTTCIPPLALQTSEQASHRLLHEEACPCNFDAELAARPDHRGNYCHQCWSCGLRIKTTALPKHLIRMHPISPPHVITVEDLYAE